MGIAKTISLQQWTMTIDCQNIDNCRFGRKVKYLL